MLQVPKDYDVTYKAFAAQGARVIGLASRQLPSTLSGPELRHMSREEVEADMDFVGFAIFQVGGDKGNIRIDQTAIL
jgi:magnesium-transporting ATPase (P-type)